MVEVFLNGEKVEFTKPKLDDSYTGDLNDLIKTGLYLGKYTNWQTQHYPGDLGWCDIVVQAFSNSLGAGGKEYRVIQQINGDKNVSTYRRIGWPIVGTGVIQWSDWKQIY